MAQSVPQIDFTAAKQIAQSCHDTLTALFAEFGAAGWLTEGIAQALSGLVFMVAFLGLAILQVVVAMGAWFGESILDAIDTARQTNKEQFNELIASTANELLGTNLSGPQLSTGSGEGSSLDQNEQLGDALLGVFEEALGGLQPVSPEEGAKNARKFAGFAINFGLSQGFLSILTEASSLGFLKEFHELPEGLKGALGLGRLQRAALAPLVRNCISQPYDLYLKYLLRPDRLSEAQIVRAFRAGQLAEDVARQQLAEKGYPDYAIDLLISDLSGKLALSELVLLLNNGDITEQDAINNLTLTGMSEDQAKLQLKAADLAAAKTQQMALLSELETAYVAGYVDQATYNSILSNLSLGDLEEQNFRAKVGFKQEVPRTTVSWGELVTAVVDAIVTFDYADQWMKNKGYGPEDQQILTYELLGKLKTASEKETYKEYKANVLRKAGKPVPPWLQ